MFLCRFLRGSRKPSTASVVTVSAAGPVKSCSAQSPSGQVLSCSMYISLQPGQARRILGSDSLMHSGQPRVFLDNEQGSGYLRAYVLVGNSALTPEMVRVLFVQHRVSAAGAHDVVTATSGHSGRMVGEH